MKVEEHFLKAMQEEINISGFFDALAPSHRGVVSGLAMLASDLGLRSFCVGGAIRDFFLAGGIVDVDLMFDRDLMALITKAEADWARWFPEIDRPKKFLCFEKYFTAKLLFEGEDESARIDLSQARQEVYPTPGSRPRVSEGDLQSDLARRDFSMNAIAFELAPGSSLEVTLRDPLGGVRDIKAKHIRVLHELSFRDDPIRMLRALRFQARLGFSLESSTSQLLISAAEANYMRLVSPTRVFEEFKKALAEPRPDVVFDLLDSHGLSDQLSPLCKLHRLVNWSDEHSWESRFLSLCRAMPQDELLKELDRLQVPKELKMRIRDAQ